MTPHFANWDERTLDLAIDRFTVGLDQRDVATLERLADEQHLEEFEHTLAAVHLSCLVDVEAPPAELLGRLERAGRLYLATSASSSEPERGSLTPSLSRTLARAGWLVAAALLLTLLLFQQGGDSDTYALREALIAEAGDLVRLEWTASEDPAAAGAGGDVVWSASLQEGYMRFQSLAPNDPQQSQYQLWIFDPTRADWEAKPVDGGVFDVPSEGEVIVPIDAKLAVRETALFAVTLEVPGGVVVSERERLVLTAAL